MSKKYFTLTAYFVFILILVELNYVKSEPYPKMQSRGAFYSKKKCADGPVRISDYIWQTVPVCCSGYIEDNNVFNASDSETLNCRAICNVRCKNGFCEKPNVCSCREGYLKKRFWDGVACEPICNDCTNGKCVLPNTCDCNYGYSSVNGTCQPACSDSCVNGKCIAPETCECSIGYRMYSFKCEPYCSTGCENGECTSPETCQCNPGWTKANNSLNVQTCVPVCDEICVNASCVPPDSCICKPGYVKIGRNSCGFYCSQCKYGKCQGINRCVCPESWKLNENGTDCNFSGTTTTETFLNVMKRNATEVTDNVHVTNSSTTETVLMLTGSPNTNNTTESKLTDERENLTWMYLVIITSVLLLAVCLILGAVYLRKIIVYFKGREHIVGGDMEEAAVTYQKTAL